MSSSSTSDTSRQTNFTAKKDDDPVTTTVVAAPKAAPVRPDVSAGAPTRLALAHIAHPLVHSMINSALQQNVMIHYYGLATDPLAFYDSNTVGGHIIEKIHRWGYPHAAGSFLHGIRDTTDAAKSLYAVAALKETLRASDTLLTQRRDFFKVLQQRPLPTNYPRALLKAQIDAYNQAQNLWAYGKQLADQACQLLDESVVFLTVPGRIQDPHKELTKTLIRTITRTSGMKFDSWPPARVAQCFGLSRKEQVMALDQDIAHSILVALADANYHHNPAFPKIVRNLKIVGCVSNKFSETRLLHGHKWSLSSLRWLIVMYLGISFKYNPSQSHPPFTPKEKEEDHPPAWQTLPKTKENHILAAGTTTPKDKSRTDITATLTRAVSEAPPEHQPPIKKVKTTPLLSATTAAVASPPPPMQQHKTEVVIDPLVDLPHYALSCLEDDPMACGHFAVTT
jgi:hypothetical protein